MMREQWREISGTDGLYEVSDQGRVRSWTAIKQGSALAQNKRRRNRKFLCVDLRINGKVRPTPVHQLVAEAFIGPRPEGAVIRHLNGDKDDNRAANLAYGTTAECMADVAMRQAIEIALQLVREELLRDPRCPNGHPRNAANTYEHEGEFRCRTCLLEKQAAYRRERRTTPVAALAR